jgi:DNA-binding transcriptional regulator PaaX
LGDPEFTDYRWVVGLALDTGLSIAPVRRALAELQESGDVRPSIEGQQDHWSLTDQGRETLADIPDEFAQLTVAHTGIQ